MLQGDTIAISQQTYPRKTKEPDPQVFNKWFWHTSETKLHMPSKTNGPFDTREAAVANAKELLVKQLPFSFHSHSDEFFVGRAVPAKVEVPASVDEIIEDVRWGFHPDDEGAFDPENWLFNVGEDKKQMLANALDQTLRQWMIDHDLLPPWYSMEEVDLVRCYDT